MVKGDKGDIETEDQRQQGNFVEAARNEGQPGCQEADPGRLGHQDRCQKIGRQDQRRRGAGIAKIAKKFPERHFCQPGADSPANGELCQYDEFVDARQFGPSHQVEQCRYADRSDQMRHRNTSPFCQEPAEQPETDKGDDVRCRQRKDARHREQRRIRSVDRLLAFDQAEKHRRGYEDNHHPHKVEQRHHIVAIDHLPCHGDGLGLAAWNAAQKRQRRFIASRPAQELIADHGHDDGCHDHGGEGQPPLARLRQYRLVEGGADQDAETKDHRLVEPAGDTQMRA